MMINMVTEKIKQNFPLAPLSTYKIGGAAEYFIAAKEKRDLEEAFAFAKEHNLNVTVLGGGSNILISDEGVKGLVIKLEHLGLDLHDNIVRCGSGVEVKTVAELALENSLSGIEWSIGIPGSMGGAIRGNAGAHGGSFDTVVESVIVFEADSFVWAELKPNDCHFAYRHSLFKEKPNWIVWEILLRLEATEDKSAMEKKMEEYREYRKTSQPKEPSAGCIFKNFFASDIEAVNKELFARAEADKKIRGGKIGAGYLIEQVNLKGTISGGAQISKQHANFLVNKNNAKAADVLALIKLIKERVKEEFGVDMEEEVQYLGF
jgi:UDP-N-acetylmuramate dehydrogenase